MLPPRPPSPPSGPPIGTYFARWNDAEPSPPLPARTSMRASSKNFMRCAVAGSSRAPKRKSPVRRRGSFGSEEPLLLGRLDRHDRLALRAVLRVLHLAGLHREEGVVLADAHVHARVEPRAALAHEDRARIHHLAAEGLQAEALAFRIAAVTRRAACFLVCHV